MSKLRNFFQSEAPKYHRLLFLDLFCTMKWDNGPAVGAMHIDISILDKRIVWCRRKQQKRGPGEKPEVAAPKWSPIPTTAVTWIPVSEPRGKLCSGHLSGVGFGWYLARISLQLVPTCWCSYPLVVRRDFAFFPCVFCGCSLRFLLKFSTACVHFRRHLGFAFSLSKYFCF